jgi:hypothetical protein
MEHMNTPSKNEEPDLEKVSPLRPARVGILQYKYDRVEELSRTANKIIDNVVKRYSKELDVLIGDVEQTLRLLKENKTKIGAGDLQRLVMRIPVEMYRVIDDVDMAGVTADVAKMAHKLVDADYYAKEKGTVPERKRLADLQAGDEATIVDLAQHAYKRLQRRMEVAELLFNAARKLVGSQDTELRVFGHAQS